MLMTGTGTKKGVLRLISDPSFWNHQNVFEWGRGMKLDRLGEKMG